MLPLMEIELGPLIPEADWVALIPIAYLIVSFIVVALLIRFLVRR